MTKWLFTDFDGTLRNPRTKDISKTMTVNEKDMNFIKEFNKENNVVVITGRPMQGVVDLLEKDYGWTPDYFVGYTGAAIYDKTGKMIHADYIAKKDKLRLLELLESYTEDLRGLVIGTPKEEMAIFHDFWGPEMQRGMLGIELKNLEINEIKELDLLAIKLMMTTDGWLRLYDQIKSEGLNIEADFNTWEGMYSIDLHSNMCNKGMAINVMKEMLDIPSKDIIVVGDDKNDLSMFNEFFHNSYIIRQEHNIDLRNKAKNVIDQIYEIKF
ncbi:HAD-IIB family hydrolase [[Acholeplasma] multilocale]|uniref:HAD-IIB family hydrolase n=1 Tax=[Acholeplasma] multilocale TaxID=264638 RepID=UPI00047B13B9|nr:HAD-IIB family hydrolase [[Acholeplasma] multilocale]